SASQSWYSTWASLLSCRAASTCSAVACGCGAGSVLVMVDQPIGQPGRRASWLRSGSADGDGDGAGTAVRGDHQFGGIRGREDLTAGDADLVAVRELDARDGDRGVRAGREAAQAVSLFGGVAELQCPVVERVGLR